MNDLAAAKIEAIKNLDLSPVMEKLMLPLPEGKGWTPAQAAEAEKWYRRFLALHALYPQHRNVPNNPIDAVWHGHILDTRKYAQDCQMIFGSMLHHYPYLGLNGDADKRDQYFRETNALYEIEFGENCMQMLQDAGHAADCSDPCTTDEG